MASITISGDSNDSNLILESNSASINANATDVKQENVGQLKLSYLNNDDYIESIRENDISGGQIIYSVLFNLVVPDTSNVISDSFVSVLGVNYNDKSFDEQYSVVHNGSKLIFRALYLDDNASGTTTSAMTEDFVLVGGTGIYSNVTKVSVQYLEDPLKSRIITVS